MNLAWQYQTLFSYHFDTTLKLMNLAAELDESKYREEQDYGRGALHALFFHLLRADSGWREGLETGHRTRGLSAENYPDIRTLSMGFEDERVAWETYLVGLSDDDIRGEISLESRPGHEVSFELWRILQHLILHGMQHHSEIARILTENGQSPGDTDFIFYQ